MDERDDQWELNHLHTLIYDEIGMCGCGWSDAAYALVRDLLDHFHDRDDRAVVEMIGGHAAAQIVLYRLQDADLIDHGTSVTSSWITDKGRYARWLMHKHPRLVEYAGYPDCWDNERGRCPDECWQPPADVPPQPPGPTMDELRERIRAEAEAARAQMSPAQRALADEIDERMTNMMLYGQHPAPDAPATGAFSGLLDTLTDWPTGLPQGEWSVVSDRSIVLPDPGYVGRLKRAAVPEPDLAPRGRRNTRIGCERHESGTWVHGDPHDCPRWARR